MKADLVIDKIDASKLYIHAEDYILREMYERFSFYAKDYKYMPKYKNGIWDGKIRLFDYRSHTIHVGLLDHVKKYAEKESLTVDIDPCLIFDNEVSRTDVANFLRSINLPFEPHVHQIDAIHRVIDKERSLVISPTSSGKSLIIYGLVRYYREMGENVLVIVPTVSLVEQMVGDFEDYSVDDSFCADDECHKIYSGKSKNSDKPIVVTTWQSVYKKGVNWFSRFGCVFVDEAHLASGKSIVGIMDKCTNADVRAGFTGTIEDAKCHELTLNGLFGLTYRTITTEELMRQKLVSQLKINCVMFDHPQRDREICKELDYAAEVKFINSHKQILGFITKLAATQTGNTLVLFRYKEHGMELCRRIKDMASGKTVFYVDGDTPAPDREAIRVHAEAHNDAIIVASFGTFSTGISIKNLYSAILAHPYKSKIKVLQSIGRVLRKGSHSDDVVVYDLVSDLKAGKKVNTTLKNFQERLKQYKKQRFNTELFRIKLPSSSQ